MGTFEKYLSVWVLICIVLGVTVGVFIGDKIQFISNLEIANVNIAVSVLVWFMIYPMMVQIDFNSIKDVSRNYKGLALTVIINWLIKPFTMAFFAWLFFSNIYSAILHPSEASQYIAGAILLGAAPCTAMVFVWSYLVKGNANYTLVQVSVNDLILLIAFVPIVGLLFHAFHIDSIFTQNQQVGITLQHAGYFSNCICFNSFDSGVCK